MGGNFWTHITAWTFLYLAQVLTADRNLFQDLGLNALPDATKINISQEEYTRMMDTYLETRRRSAGADPNTIPKLITFKMMSPKKVWRLRRAGGGDSSTLLKFSLGKVNRLGDVDSAQLKILVPAVEMSTDIVVRVKVLQVLGTHRRRLIDQQELHLSQNLTKWCEFDITSAVRYWFDAGVRNLGLELACADCRGGGLLRPIRTAVSALVYPIVELERHRRDRDRDRDRNRNRRSSSGGLALRSRRTTDCRQSPAGAGSPRCCRHDMLVKFADLKFPEMRYIVQPKMYEAGFCQGQCPPNFNHATNHSRIQSLVHQMNRKHAKRTSSPSASSPSSSRHHRGVPKACCTPSKLEPLEILRVNPTDSTKLIVEKWDNMQVVKCACS